MSSEKRHFLDLMGVEANSGAVREEHVPQMHTARPRIGITYHDHRESAISTLGG